MQLAKRPLFISEPDAPFWSSINIEFKWFPGMSSSQKRKSIDALHESSRRQTQLAFILEVSSHSASELGSSLSAFRLRVDHRDLGPISLESAFQGSKVFADAGHIHDAYRLTPPAAKAVAREVDTKDNLIGFHWQGRDWPLEPKTWFYDWLYLNAVVQAHPDAIDSLRTFDGFTDIEFNPAKSFNCQARSCAIIASTTRNEAIQNLIDNPELMVRGGTNPAPEPASQPWLF